MWITLPQTKNLLTFAPCFAYFEDNETVIKMLLKGRSPTLRHVSQTHRVALGWLFDRINLDTKAKSSTMMPQTQLADMVTQGNFTRGEWDHFLRFFNIRIFPMFSLYPFQFNSQPSNHVEEDCVVAKSTPMLASKTVGLQLGWVRVHLTPEGH